jgi:hippurate hydrolase
MDRFGIEEVYGLHNIPGMPVASFAIRAGGIMAATDEFTITLEGNGGHAAIPHKAIDTVVVAAQLILALQTVVSRNIDPMRSAVLSITMVEAGDAFNIIPRRVKLTGTIRTLEEAERAFMEERLRTISTGIAATFGVKVDIAYRRGYPPTVNAAEQTGIAAEVARSVVGAAQVNDHVDGAMTGEDFAYMLQARPGAYILMGNGNSSQLHTDTYDFNDEAIPVGVSYWSRLVETVLSAKT